MKYVGQGLSPRKHPSYEHVIKKALLGFAVFSLADGGPADLLQH